MTPDEGFLVAESYPRLRFPLKKCLGEIVVLRCDHADRNHGRIIFYPSVQ